MANQARWGRGSLLIDFTAMIKEILVCVNRPSGRGEWRDFVRIGDEVRVMSGVLSTNNVHRSAGVEDDFTNIRTREI